MATATTSSTPGRGRPSFADLSVNVKVLSAVAVAALVALLIGINGIRSLGHASESAQHIYRNNVSSIKAVGDLRIAVTQARSDLANQALSPDEASVTKFTQAFLADLDAFDAAIAAYRAHTSAGDPAVIDKVQTTWATYTTIARGEMLPAGAKHDLVLWSTLRDTKTLPLLTSIYADLTALAEAETADAARNAAAAKSGYESSRLTAILTLILGVRWRSGWGRWWPAGSSSR
jgi:methyl-accepting chemotaxis protein